MPDNSGQPRSPKSAAIIGTGRSQAVCPALPCPCHTDPQAQASPWCPGGCTAVHSPVLSHLHKTRHRSPRPQHRSPRCALPAPQPRCRPPARAACPQAPAGPAPTGPHLRPLLGPDADLAVAAFLRVQGAHEGPDGRPSNHVHGDAILRQGPDDAHLRAASTPTGAGSQRPLCPPGPRAALLSCPLRSAHFLHTSWEWGNGGNSGGVAMLLSGSRRSASLWGAGAGSGAGKGLSLHFCGASTTQPETPLRRSRDPRTAAGIGTDGRSRQSNKTIIPLVAENGNNPSEYEFYRYGNHNAQR